MPKILTSGHCPTTQPSSSLSLAFLVRQMLSGAAMRVTHVIHTMTATREASQPLLLFKPWHVRTTPPLSLYLLK